ncbi:MAG: polynucleotide adenylyltransferase, partial [Clostridia bacterium]|nr:polynucleotide adenylyltransferase [Clostridia bacterium]
TKQRVCQLVKYHDRQIEETPRAVKRLLTKLSFDDVRALLKLKRSDNLAQAVHVREERCAYLDRVGLIVDEIENEGACLSLRSLCINGNDLKALGIAEGKKIGEILNAAFKMVVDDKLPNDKEKLLEFVKNYIK